jgi:nicotinamidase-related amidase
MNNTPTAPFRDSPRGNAALLIIDMISAFDFAGGDTLQKKASKIVDPILRLRADVEAQGWPVIYVNDNFGEWHSERSRLVDSALEHGNAVSERLKPNEADYFIIKPQFSGFYATNLPVLLPKLGVSRLILTGVATDICVLFTAGDAHMRDYDLWVPADAVAAEADERGRWALEIMANSMDAQIAPTSEMGVAEWVDRLC